MQSENSTVMDNRIFGLDIGTRSVVGIVGCFEGDKFKVVAFSSREHQTRSMIDGQIHDIEKVTATIREVKEDLELQFGHPLRKVSIAAAGRVLKTALVKVNEPCDPTVAIDYDLVNALELSGMEKAHQQINQNQGQREMGYHCVGYTVAKYYLNDYPIATLIGHTGKTIGADVLATFLPQEVVDSLYAVVAKSGLEVYSLTLEPIAAIHLAIPEQFRLLNIALIDIGAGTSDIAITKHGSIVAYGMIPYAGDELTETIMHKYLVDFQTAERMKIESAAGVELISFQDIIGLSHQASLNDVRSTMAEACGNLTEMIAAKINELNGGKPTSAVFVVGGGGQIHNFTEQLSERLGLPAERVAIRGKGVMENIDFSRIGLEQSPDLVTPVGICLTGYKNRKGDFIQVYLNEEPMRIFNNNNLTVMEVAAFKGYDPEKLITRNGRSLNYMINGSNASLSGELGRPARVYVNGLETAMTQPIAMNDSIVIIPSKRGQDATLTFGELENKLTATITVNGTIFPMRPVIKLDGNSVSLDMQISDGDRIEIEWPTLDDFMSANGQPREGRRFYAHHGPVGGSYRLEPEDIIRVEDDKSVAILVQVNLQQVRMTGKESYVFVDVFDYIDFDLTKPKGIIKCFVNGLSADYMMPLKDGDTVEVFWSDRNSIIKQ